MNALEQRPIQTAARYDFDSDQIAAMRRTVAKDCNDSEFVLFMEVCGRYQLDPFAKHIYAVKMDGRVQMIVSRDGLLAIANRYPDFRGIEGDVVREGDKLERTANGFEHTYEATEAKERQDKAIVAAWAKVYREGRAPAFFLAQYGSYKRGNKVWTSYPDAMILKVAESMALRKAFSVAGLIPEDELGVSFDEGDQPRRVNQEPDWGTDPTLAAWLPLLFARANELHEGAFKPQKVRFTMASADQPRRHQIARELVDYIKRNGGEVPGEPEVPETVEGEAVEEAAAEPAEAAA